MTNAGTKEANRRKFTRTRLQARVEVRLSHGMIMEGESFDVSLTGLLMRLERTLPVGNLCRIALVIGGGGGQCRIDIEGRVVRVDDSGLAIEFAQLHLDGLDQLRRLILYNAEDAEAVEREFESL